VSGKVPGEAEKWDDVIRKITSVWGPEVAEEVLAAITRLDLRASANMGDVPTFDGSKYVPQQPSGDVVAVAAAAPVDPTLGQLWARQLDISSGYQLYRFAGGEAWQALGAGVGAGATDGPFADTVTRQVGIIVGDPGDGYFAGLTVNTSDGVAHIKYESADGATSARVECTPTSLRLSYLGVSHFPTILMDENGLQVYGLPTADPAVAGALWQSGTDLKISAG
jgi:hypothetical protein